MKMVTILMMSAKMATPVFLKIKGFRKKFMTCDQSLVTLAFL